MKGWHIISQWRANHLITKSPPKKTSDIKKQQPISRQFVCDAFGPNLFYNSLLMTLINYHWSLALANLVGRSSSKFRTDDFFYGPPPISTFGTSVLMINWKNAKMIGIIETWGFIWSNFCFVMRRFLEESDLFVKGKKWYSVLDDFVKFGLLSSGGEFLRWYDEGEVFFFGGVGRINGCQLSRKENF